MPMLSPTSCSHGLIALPQIRIDFISQVGLFISFVHLKFFEAIFFTALAEGSCSFSLWIGYETSRYMISTLNESLAHTYSDRTSS